MRKTTITKVRLGCEIGIASQDVVINVVEGVAVG